MLEKLHHTILEILLNTIFSPDLWCTIMALRETQVSLCLRGWKQRKVEIQL